MSTSTRVSRKTLSPQCSCTSAEPGSRASSMSWTAGSSSRSSVDGGRDVLGLGARRRDAHGDEFADLAHLAGGQHRLLGDLEARQPRDRADRLDAGEIGRGEDAVAIALRHVDAADAAHAPAGCARRRRPACPASRMSADELAAPAHQAVVFLARQPRADALSGACPPAEGNSRSLRTVTFSSIELTLTSYAATACGRIGATASYRVPARRQNAGCSRRSAMTSLFSLSRRTKRPRSFVRAPRRRRPCRP